MRWRSAGGQALAVAMVCCAAAARAQTGDGGWLGPVIDLGAAGTPEARLGAAIAAAGDVNGDELEDLVVGAPGGRGAVYLFHGQGDGGFGAPRLLLAGDGGGLGRSVSGRCDLNGDGRADLVAGAPDQDRVVVFFGQRDGGFLVTELGPEEDAGPGVFGASVACASRFGGGGAVLAVGAPRLTNRMGQIGAGAVFVYQPDALGALEREQSFEGSGAGDQCGTALALLPYTPDGGAYIYTGCPGATDGVLQIARTSSGFQVVNVAPATAGRESLGAALDVVGDVNGDGALELLAGAPNAPGSSGLVASFDALTLAPGASWTAATGRWMGSAVTRAGDLNGDGFADVVVSDHEGAIVLGLGDPTSGINARFEAQEGLSLRPAGIGDVNGDGFSDVAIGLPEWSQVDGGVLMRPGAGGFVVVLGRARGPAMSRPARALPLGEYVRSGDVNGDGADDVLRRSASDGGLRLLLSPFDAPRDVAVDLPTAAATRVVSAGDVNGDGCADLLFGVPSAGVAYVSLGRADGGAPERAFAVTRQSMTDRFAEGIAGAGDVNGDGYDDIVVGAPGGLAGRGELCVFFGGRDGLRDDSRACWSPPSPMTQGLGFEVDGAGDVDGDGRADVVAAAESGEVFALSVLADGGGLVAAATWRPAASPIISVQGATDVDGDGRSDVLVVNSRQFSVLSAAPGTAGGEVFVAPREVRAGVAVGDVNGDGLGDVAGVDSAGAPLLLLGDRDRVLRQRPSSSPGESFARLAALGDLNRDGFNDLAAWSQNTAGVVLGGDLAPGRPMRLAQRFDGAERGRGFVDRRADDGSGQLRQVVTFSADLTDEVAGLGPLVLEVEACLVDRSGACRWFSSQPALSAGTAAVEAVLPPGRYRWRGRVVSGDRAGRWRAYGANDARSADFSLVIDPVMTRDGGAELANGGPSDAGAPDAGPGPAGDGGVEPRVFDTVGCGCGALPGAPGAALLVVVLVHRGRRRRR